MSGNQQYLQTISSGYPNQSLTIPYSAPNSQQLLVHSVEAYNGTASPNGVGLFQTVNNSQFKVYQLGASDTNVTSAIQAGTATTIFSTTNNHGVLFQAKEKFSLITFNVSQAQTGSPVYTYEYYNGSSYSTLSLINTPVFSSTGIKAILFYPPADWVAGDGTEDGDSEMYSIRVLATTAPSQAVQINSLQIGKMLKYNEYVPQAGSVIVNFETDPYLLQAGEAIIPFFSYTSSSNRIELAYKINP